MSATTLISAEEYLARHYHPDCDYVDGVLLERNVGEKEHSFAQKRLINLLERFETSLGVSVWPEVRIQISGTRFRIPDICIYLDPDPPGSVFRNPPFLAIEILSTEDRMSRIQEKLEDYFAFGVTFVWVNDPLRRTGWVYTSDGSKPAREGTLSTANPVIEVPLNDLFSRA